MVRRYGSQSLDSVDMLLIRELEIDARQAISELSLKTGVGDRTVRRRIHRLLDEDVIRIVALPDPFALGYVTVAILGINVERGHAQAVVEELASSERISGVVIVTGRYNILAWVFCQDLEELSDFITMEIGNIPAVSSVETMITLDIWKNSYSVLADDKPIPPRISKRQVADAIDVALFTELEINAMQ